MTNLTACFVDIQTSHPPCMLLCLQRNSAGSENPSDAFRFLVEERIQCCQSRRVRYTQRVDYCIQLPAPIEAATNRGKGAPRRTHTHKMFCWQVATAGMTLGSGGISCWESAGPSLKGQRRSRLRALLLTLHMFTFFKGYVR